MKPADLNDDQQLARRLSDYGEAPPRASFPPTTSPRVPTWTGTSPSVSAGPNTACGYWSRFGHAATSLPACLTSPRGRSIDSRSSASWGAADSASSIWRTTRNLARSCLEGPASGGALSAELRRRFLREAKTAAVLAHPHIVSVYDAEISGVQCWIASEYCRGPTLKRRLGARTEGVDPALPPFWSWP